MKRLLLALPLLAALPFAASASDGLSYNYVEGGYVQTNADGGDADGFGGQASFAIHPNFHLFGGYSNQEIEDTNIDIDHWRAGVGYNHPVSSNTDLLSRVAYEKYEVGAGLDVDGYSAEVGVRSALTPMLEGYALAGYEDGGRLDDDVYGRLGAQLKFNQNWGVSGDVKLANGDTQWTIGPRFTW